mmetsp:Transcript_34677/g.84914  ORF Transcript_34677/g.84914 Transcript_34677/m.84914 type:complete len:97 (-) Transcript_34677:220-510(-)
MSTSIWCPSDTGALGADVGLAVPLLRLPLTSEDSRLRNCEFGLVWIGVCICGPEAGEDGVLLAPSSIGDADACIAGDDTRELLNSDTKHSSPSCSN